MIRLAAALAALAVAAAPGAAAGQPQDELRELRGRIEALKKNIAAAEGARAEAADELRASETAISEANRNLRELAAERDRLHGEQARIAGDAAALQADLARRQAALARALHARHLEGAAGPLRLVLSGDDPQAIARALVYRGYLARAQAEIIEKARADLARLASLDATARGQAAALAALEGRARAERDAVAAQAAARRAVLAKHAHAIALQRRDLESAERNEARLARLVDALARAVQKPGASAPDRRAAPSRPGPDAPALGAFGSLKGRLPVPVKGQVAQRYGSGTSERSPSSKGLFFRAPAGADVRAVAGGRVVFADWMRGYGNLLILDHGDGYLSIYGNNESVLRRVGDQVHGGDAVATVGSSGGNESSGLYFEARFQGRPFDPLPWLNPK